MALIRPNNRALQDITTLPTAVSSDYLAAAADVGKVLQVVNYVTDSNTSFSTTSTSPVSTELTLSITPSSASNKVLVLANPSLWLNSYSQQNGTNKAYLYRNGSSVFRFVKRIYNYNNGSGFYTNSADSLVYLDSPSTTSATTYTLYIECTDSNTVGFTSDTAQSAITLLEIAG